MQIYEYYNDIIRMSCDKCGSEILNVRDLYEFKDLELCEDCLKELAPPVRCAMCGTGLERSDLYFCVGDKEPLCWECFKSVHRADLYDIY